MVGERSYSSGVLILKRPRAATRTCGPRWQKRHRFVKGTRIVLDDVHCARRLCVPLSVSSNSVVLIGESWSLRDRSARAVLVRAKCGGLLG